MGANSQGTPSADVMCLLTRNFLHPGDFYGSLRAIACGIAHFPKGRTKHLSPRMQTVIVYLPFSITWHSSRSRGSIMFNWICRLLWTYTQISLCLFPYARQWNNTPFLVDNFGVHLSLDRRNCQGTVFGCRYQSGRVLLIAEKNAKSVFVLFLSYAPFSYHESCIHEKVLGKPNEENTLLININFL